MYLPQLWFVAEVRNKAELTTPPYTLMGAVLAPFWSGGSLIGAALLELIRLLLERWLLLEPIRLLLWSCSGSFWSGGSFWSRSGSLFGADLAPFGAEAPFGADPAPLIGAALAPSWS